MTRAWRILQPALQVRLGWDECRIGDLVELVNGFPFDSANFRPSGDLPLLRIRDLNAPAFETYVSGQVPGHVMVRDGDVVIGMDGDFNVVRWRRGPAALNQRLCLLRPKHGVDIRFVAYWLPDLLSILNDLAYSTTVKHLSSFEVLSERVLLPPLDVQRRVADFLDEQVALLDRAIELRRRQSELLAEQLECGLVDLMFGRATDSVRLGHVAIVDHGRQRSPNHESGPFMTKYLRSANVKPGTLVLDDVKLMNFNPAEQARYRLVRGDVLVTEASGSPAAIGAPARWTSKSEEIVCFQNHLLRLRPKGQVITADYLWWWSRASFAAGAMRVFATGANILNLGSESIRSMGVPRRNLVEQDRVSAACDEWNDLHSSALARVLRGLTLLQERKQALITAVVTGAFDVSTASARNVA